MCHTVEYRTIWHIRKVLAHLRFYGYAQRRRRCPLCHLAHLPYPQGVATNPRDVGEFTRTIANEVRLQRLERRWKQEKLSEKAEINRATLSRMERGVVAIDMEQLDRLAQAFEMAPEELVASARRRAQGKGGDETYLPDGRLNPANIRGGKPSKQDLDELIKRRSSEG